MSAARFAANTLYKFNKPNLLNTEGAKLPEAYKNFYKEWKLTRPAPVHYVPPPSEWVRNEETGEVKRVADVPIPVKFVPESHKGIWGGEGVIKGFQKRELKRTRVPHFWVPNLKKSAVYSEILDKRMEMIVTERTIDLIIDNLGFDNYILKTKACDLQSSLALKLKRKMLQALHHKTLYPNDPLKRDQVYAKYQHFLEPVRRHNEFFVIDSLYGTPMYSDEDVEWYGLTFDEALRKYDKLEAQKDKPAPLKNEFRIKLIEQLAKEAEEEANSSATSDKDKKGWHLASLGSKLNPFAKKP